LLAVLVVMLLGCNESSTTSPEAALSLQVIGLQQSLTPIDRANIYLQGPEERALAALPGEEVRIDDLDPGSYQVAVEGLAGAEVVWFDEISAVINPGETARRSITARSFSPADVMVDDTGGSTVVSWTPVQGAREYRVEVSGLPGTEGFVEQGRTVQNSLDLGDLGPGSYLYRVLAVNRFGSVGEPAEAQAAPEPGDLRVNVTTVGLNGDLPLADVAVSVQGVGSSFTDARSTGADGGVLFEGLESGDYEVTVQPPSPAFQFPTAATQVSLQGTAGAEAAFRAERVGLTVTGVTRTLSGGLLADVALDVFPRGGTFPARLTGVNVDMIEAVQVSPGSPADVRVEILSRSFDALELEVSSEGAPGESTEYSLSFSNPINVPLEDAETIQVVPFRPQPRTFEVVNGITSLERGVSNTIQIESTWETAGTPIDYTITSWTINNTLTVRDVDPGEQVSLARSGFEQTFSVELRHTPDDDDEAYWVEFLGEVDGVGAANGADLYIPVDSETLPTVLVMEPASFQSFRPGEPVTFSLIAVDPLDGNRIRDDVFWFTSRGGFLGAGEAITVPGGLVEGDQTLSIRILDRENNPFNIEWRVQVSPSCPGRCYHD
jgi:hypothetical protein